MQSYILLQGLADGFLSVVVYFMLNGLLFRLKKRIRELQRKDYLPPPPSDNLHRVKIWLATFFTWLFAGRMHVEGESNLTELPKDASFTLAPNHSHVSDIFIAPLLMKRWKARFMASPSVMKWFAGAFGFLFGSMGAFTASRKAGVEVLSTGQSMLLFPEGWVNLDGAMSRCKTGIVQISKEAEQRLGRPVYIVPVYMRFAKYPGPWIRKMSMASQLAWLLPRFWQYRAGVRIVIGKAIASNTLPDDYELATSLIAQEIQALDPAR